MEMELFLYDSPAFKNFLKDNPHEAGEVKYLESIAKEGMHVIDIGANIGITTVAISKRIGRRGKLYSFEPTPEYFNILKDNVSSNGLENVEVYELAVTDKAGRVPFYQKGLSSGIVFEEGAKKFEVSTTTIDRFLSEEKIGRIDLINMDCEGSELLALRGAKQTLSKNKVKIFCEIHHDFLKQLGQSVEDIVQYLQGLEFQVQTISLNDLKVGNNFENCEYIYAHNVNQRKDYAYL
ncbi:MAG: FkbM family methyltransferase [Chloroflexota bacterium]|nr:FkbM family methyltransferase [Chloroflexota bacterium]